ncbi:MAG TPA: DUF2490 domain-containing protein [Cyclobacteriaceae bacterium]|nr:DUF2490 domain-containing protein [Cyclobacteriaceae bacterium]
MIRCLVSVLLLAPPVLSSAQRSNQLWLDYQLDYPFANQYLFEVVASYQTVLDGQKWRNYNMSPTFEYQFFRRMDLIGTMPINYTLQKEGANTLGLDPALGARFHITQNKRIDSRLILKTEHRFFYQIEDKDWESSTRLRLKAEALIAINGPNLFADRLWHAILDYEEFFVMDQQVNERFANRRRARLGVGYRLDYKNRFELIYTRQSTRDEIDGDFTSDDNIIQLRYKMYLNPNKNTTTP